jgi:hypothetical protein
MLLASLADVDTSFVKLEVISFTRINGTVYWSTLN